MRYLAKIDCISFASLLLFLGYSRVLEYMVNKIQFLNLNVIPVPLCYRAPSTFTSSLFVFLSLHIFLTLLLSLFCKQLLLRMRYLAKIDCISFACFDISKLFICIPVAIMGNKIQIFNLNVITVPLCNGSPHTITATVCLSSFFSISFKLYCSLFFASGFC
jgi:hypothetical protein